MRLSLRELLGRTPYLHICANREPASKFNSLKAISYAANVYLPKDRVTNQHMGYGFVEFRSEEDADYVSLPQLAVDDLKAICVS